MPLVALQYESLAEIQEQTRTQAILLKAVTYLKYAYSSDAVRMILSSSAEFSAY